MSLNSAEGLDKVRLKNNFLEGILKNASLQEMIKIINTPDFDVNAPIKTGTNDSDKEFSPLALASMYGRLDIVKVLLKEKKALYTIPTAKLASRNGHYDIVSYLQENQDLLPKDHDLWDELHPLDQEVISFEQTLSHLKTQYPPHLGQGKIINKFRNWLNNNHRSTELLTPVGVCNGLCSWWLAEGEGDRIEGEIIKGDKIFDILEKISNSNEFDRKNNNLFEAVLDHILTRHDKRSYLVGKTQLELDDRKPKFQVPLLLKQDQIKNTVLTYIQKLQGNPVVRLFNSNHVIALKKIGNGFEIYDPNFSGGKKSIKNLNECADFIESALGKKGEFIELQMMVYAEKEENEEAMTKKQHEMMEEVYQANGANIDQQSDHNHYSLLMLASSMGDINAVKWCLEKNSNPEQRSSENHTALYLAANNGFTEVVEELLKSNAKIFPDPPAISPLVGTAVYGRTEVLNIFLKKIELEKRKEILDKPIVNKQTLLQLCITSPLPNYDTIDCLIIDWEADINAPPNPSPLLLAIKKGDVDLVRKLLDYAEPNLKKLAEKMEKSKKLGQSDKVTQLEQLKKLVESGKFKPLNLNQKNDKNNPLSFAVQNKQYTIAEALIKAGATPDESLLKYAIRNNDEGMIHILLKKTQTSEELLALAVKYSDYDMAEKLIAQKAKVNRTLLGIASKDSTMFKRLLENSQKIDDLEIIVFILDTLFNIGDSSPLIKYTLKKYNEEELGDILNEFIDLDSSRVTDIIDNIDNNKINVKALIEKAIKYAGNVHAENSLKSLNLISSNTREENIPPSKTMRFSKNSPKTETDVKPFIDLKEFQELQTIQELQRIMSEASPEMKDILQPFFQFYFKKISRFEFESPQIIRKDIAEKINGIINKKGFPNKIETDRTVKKLLGDMYATLSSSKPLSPAPQSPPSATSPKSPGGFFDRLGFGKKKSSNRS